MGGSLATVSLPQAVSGNTFNADNEMTGFNGTALSYNANDNLLSDGANTYTLRQEDSQGRLWDARNQLSAISGGVSASFAYGPFGRRTGRNVNGVVTQFLGACPERSRRDGLNPVAELDGASPPNVTANLLTGLGIDEYFERTDASGTMAFLTDALGSTIGLVDSAGAINTSYTYDPFGNTTISGSSTSPYQFTGREDDGTGLYFYRARYYSPTFQRLVSQDPLDFRGGGPDLYIYVLNNPIDAMDPLGLTINACKKGDCPPSPPTGPGWTPDATIGGLPQWIRQHLTHPGETCYEMMVNGRYLHCCYDSNGSPVYGPWDSAWEDYPPNSLGHWWETWWYLFSQYVQ